MRRFGHGTSMIDEHQEGNAGFIDRKKDGYAN